MAQEEKQENVNTEKSIREATKVSGAQLDKEMKSASQILGKEKKVAVTIPKYLVKRLGHNVPVGINGAVIHVPVGQKVEIPESMAKQLNNSIAELKL